jgi:hypothetical protein
LGCLYSFFGGLESAAVPGSVLNELVEAGAFSTFGLLE